MKFKKVNNCQLCGGTLNPIWDLGETPLANSFLESSIKPKKFPLVLAQCKSCGESQLNYLVNPKILFSNYLYLTDYSPSLVKHFEKYAQEIYSIYNRPIKVLEIGSNSGVLLKEFQKLGCSEVLGIEPAENLVKIANEKGVKTIQHFFSEQLSEDLKLNYRAFDVIVANNVFAHVEDLPGILRGCLSLLKNSDSLLVFENAYWLDTVKNGYFDQIYHEHMFYHGVKPINKLINSLGGSLIDVTMSPIQGGSVRFFCRKGHGYSRANVGYAILNEDHYGIYKENIYIDWNQSFKRKKEVFTDWIKTQKNEGKTNVIYGFPAKSTTLFNSLISDDLSNVDFVVDDSPFKQNLYTPDGSKLIFDPKVLKDFDAKSLNLIVGAWNCFDDIVNKNSNLTEAGAKFVNPFKLI